jgi:ubiquinone biosynthesis protein
MSVTIHETRRKSHLGRYREIASVLIKHRLRDMIKMFGLEKFLPFHILPPETPWGKDNLSASARTRLALEELGVTFVKVGQILSTRTDILPSDFIQELTKLQSSLTPLPVSIIEQAISDELHRPVNEIFRNFDPTPLGVASIGQAHAATLHDDTEVVVKVRKPGVVEQVQEDLDILRQLARRAEERGGSYYNYNLSNLVEEISDTINAEMDYIREGHTAEHFAQFFREDKTIHIPRVLWQYTTSRVIVLERIRGIGILDIPALQKAGFNLKVLSQRAVAIWLRMVFEDGMFHADPHPGNLFVESNGHLGLIDFGMSGFIDDEIRDQLATAVKAIIDRDVDVLIETIIDMGAVAPLSSRESLRADLKHVMGHFPQMAEFYLATNLGELFNVIRRNGVQFPANTFLLLKTMAMVQALGRGLDPAFDFFQELQPHVEHIYDKRYSLKATVQRFPGALADLAVFGAGLPRRVIRIVRSMERGELRIRSEIVGLDYQVKQLRQVAKFLIIGIIGASVILGATILALAFRI